MPEDEAAQRGEAVTTPVSVADKPEDRPASSCCSTPIATSSPIPTPCWCSYDFGRAHHRVLHFVDRHPGMRVADLLDILKIPKQSLGRVLKELIDTGFIEQVPGPVDRRQGSACSTPTVKGRALLGAG